KIGQSAALLQDPEEVKKCLLVHDLRRAGDVAMTIFKGIGRQTPRPQQMLERGRKQIAKFWGSVRPLIGDILAMMAEKSQIELEPAVRTQAHNFPHVIDKRRAAVGRKSHHLVLVAIMEKSQILRDRLIKNAE